MVETKLRLRKQVGPAVRGESGVAGREGGDQVVFGSAAGPLCRVGAVVWGGGVLVLEGEGD